MITEEWKAVVNYEGLYEVSSFGRVRSVARRAAYSRPGYTRAVGSRLMKQPIRNGYPHLTLSKNGIKTKYSTHRLVLEAFRGPCPDGQMACHEDDNPANCTLTNLRWGTALSNADDRRRNGNYKYYGNHWAQRDPERFKKLMLEKAWKNNPKGERVNTAKLTVADVKRIRAICIPRHPLYSVSALAVEYGVSAHAISMIVRRLNWKHVA